jgi:peptidoglycan/LPS O-acetylase OafA/YrhL
MQGQSIKGGEPNRLPDYNSQCTKEQWGRANGRQPNQRLDFVDNLRWIMIIFVVGMHAACTYSGLGGWYYHTGPAPDLPSLLFFLGFQSSLQAFFMGFLFFLAGYFVPPAYDRKGFVRFVGDRAFRLGLPTLLYVFVINIGMGIFLLDWYAKSGLSLPEAYLLYLSEWHWIDGTGPMWFATALLIFSGLYALFRLVARRIPSRPEQPKVPTFLTMINLAVAVGAVTFLVRQFAPFGTSWHTMQLCFFPQYIVLFILGIVARRRGWVDALPAHWGNRALTAALIGAPLSIVALTMINSATHGTFDDVRGGMHYQAAIYAVWEQIVCVLFCTGLLVVFRDRFNVRNKVTGFFSDNSFAVYVIHPPVLVAISLGMRQLHWPPLEMFAVAWVAALAASFVLGAVLRGVPVLRRIF